MQLREDRVDARPGVGITLRRSLLILPALAAMVYPWLLSALSLVLRSFGVSAPPTSNVVGGSTVVILLSAWGVMGVSAALALKLGQIQNDSGLLVRGRVLAHLAFAAPSCLVGFGNVAGILNLRATVPYAWLVFWALLAGTVFLPRGGMPSAAPHPVSQRRLAVAHGISALAILLLFVLPHIGNHLLGIWNGATHIAAMKLARQLYRSEIVEPLLLALIAFQIASGSVLVQRRLSRPGDFFGTLQTLTGTYVGVYLLAHMTAAFSARFAGTDTNWNWLTNDDKGLLAYLSFFPLVAHYWVGPVAIVTHVACGLRVVMLEHRVPQLRAAQVAWGLIIAGGLASSVILAGLLGAHVA
jgi:hypothetical protein